jgi:hypothetical protein
LTENNLALVNDILIAVQLSKIKRILIDVCSVLVSDGLIKTNFGLIFHIDDEK